MKIRKMTAPAVALTVLSAVWLAGCPSDTATTDDATTTTSSTRSETVTKSEGTGTSGAVKTVSIKEGFDVPAFDVYTVSGEQKGETLCYV